MQIVINSAGTSIRKRNERFVIRRNNVAHEFAASKVTSLVVATRVFMSSDVIQLANQHNVDIVFLDRSGMPTARVWQSKLGSTAAIRRRQLEMTLRTPRLLDPRRLVLAQTTLSACDSPVDNNYFAFARSP